MECKTVIQSEYCHEDDKTRIRDDVNEDKVLTKSQKLHILQNETHFEECDMDTKIRINQETWDPNVVSSDIKSNPVTLHPVPFLSMGTIKDVNEMNIKEEHFNQEEVSTESQKRNLLQNETYFEECVWNKDVDTKLGIKQEMWDVEYVVSSDIKSDPENPPTSIGMGTIEDGGDIDIKDEPWCFDRKSTDSYEEKESDAEKIEASKEPLPLESPRLLTEAAFCYRNVDTFLDAEKHGDSHQKVCGRNASQGTSRQNICSLNCNSINDGNNLESEQNKGDEMTSVFKCEICGKCYRHKSSLQRHTLFHAGTSYKCDKCEKCFTQKSDLKRHKLLHTGTKPYKCDKCEKCFTQKSDLQTHSLLHLGIKAHKCEVCEKCFTRKSYLKCHKLSHSGSRPYKCDSCEKVFTQISDLKRHKFLHSGTKPYKCDTCEKCFIRKSDLETHSLLHLGIKAHKCEVCEKCFTSKSYLQCHKLSHLGSAPYKCDSCEKAFTQISGLKRHKLLHTGTKPYKCDICRKCFTRKIDLQTHSLLHSGIKPHRCNICGKCFTWKSSLLRHTVLH